MVDPAHPEFVPDPSLSREGMEDLQREIGGVAVFEDDIPFDPSDVAIDDAFDLTAGVPEAYAPAERLDRDLAERPDHDAERPDHDADAPVIVGIDQSFLDDRALSAVVAIQDGVVVERVHAVTPLEIPYIPGLLAFREGGPILEALSVLSVEPDLAVFDGSGRLHFREAGIATHVGVACDLPSLGVAKSQLCGELDADPAGRPQGWSTPIRAGDDVESPADTVVGYASQSRQFESSRRINPLYLSPGHRVSAKTTLELVERLCAGYKLPEPTRLADAYAEAAKDEL